MLFTLKLKSLHNPAMGIAQFIKIIGRGSKGSGDLDREQAREVFSQILGGSVSDLELGAFCIAMRIKGESIEELAGFMDAIQPHLTPLNPGLRPTIVLPSYNGARKQVNLTPLLAGLLAKQGFTVLVQGVVEDPSRITTYEIFQELGWPILKTELEFSAALDTQLPIFCPLKIISPDLQKLLDIRTQIGLRNSGHVLAKLINPASNQAWQVCNYTHPEYPEKLKAYFRIRPSNAILMRGSEGEPTASLSRLPEMNFISVAGQSETTPEEKFEDYSPFMGMDAISTATTTKEILDRKISAPTSIVRQVHYISVVTGIS